MSPDLVGAILEKVRATWVVANDLEVTLEANPTSVEAGRFRGYRDAGVNRVSVGIQALRDTDLKALGRKHSVAEAKAALGLARDVFDRVSFDLIYARQGQGLTDWRTELAEALAMAADHLSLYQLTIEDGTAFGDRFRRGRLRGLPDEDLAADMYLLTQEMTEAAGLPAYEVSNHARPGAESRHNLIYWRSGDWAGIGPGAHGRLTLGGVREATETLLSPVGWLRQVETTGSGEGGREIVNAEDAAAEAIMMGLRLAEGLAVEAVPADKTIVINELMADGLLRVEGDRVHATPEGRLVLNRITGALLA
jgi:oxygen-independent coproporphyrinogen-3 oxidase